MPVESGKSIVLDFSNVKDQSGFNPTHQEAGDYRGIIKDVAMEPSKAGNQMVTYAISDSDRPSAVYRYNCVLTDTSLWKLRNLFIAAGKNISKKKLKLTATHFNALIGKEIGMSLDDDEYEGKMRSQIVGVFPASDLEDATDEPADDDDTEDEDADEVEDEPAPPVKKKTKAAPAKTAAKTKKKAAPVEEEEEDLDELDIDDL